MSITAAAANAAAEVSVPKKPSQSERFTLLVMKAFNQNIAGGLQVTDYQRQLIQGYFIGIDRALKTAEENRLTKNKNNSKREFDNPLPCTWENVNALDLALDVVHYARMGLDMMQDNHLSPIPYRNKKTDKYDITLMPGYNGIQYIAEKYAVEPPLAVTIELVYTTDHFKPIMKSVSNKVSSYEFEIPQPFDRGDIVGGFGYIEYEDPTKNKLIFMPIAAILKRKPEYAAAEFWGGKSKRWTTNEAGKRVQQEVEVDGWFEEMCWKTLKREVYSSKHIPRDPKKIDNNYQHMKLQEARIADMNAQAEIYDNANADIIDIPEVKTVETSSGIPANETPAVEEPPGGPDF